MAGKKGSASPAGRAKKPIPERTGPIRDGWTPPGLAGAKGHHTGGHEDVGEAVAEAVRAGYRVIGENLRQGRAAADRRAAGRYEIAGTPGRFVDACNESAGRTLTFFRSSDRVIIDGNEEVRTESRGGKCPGRPPS